MVQARHVGGNRVRLEPRRAHGVLRLLLLLLLVLIFVGYLQERRRSVMLVLMLPLEMWVLPRAVHVRARRLVVRTKRIPSQRQLASIGCVRAEEQRLRLGLRLEDVVINKGQHGERGLCWWRRWRRVVRLRRRGRE